MPSMPAYRLEIAPHLTPAEIRKRERSCQNVVEREHWQILRLLTREGYACSCKEAAVIVGRSAASIHTLMRRYNRHGPSALADGRRGRAGRKAALTEAQRQQLVAAVRAAPMDDGLWTGSKVAAWVQEHAGKRVSKVTGWQYLRRLGFTLQVPRPRHSESATPAEKTVWKKNAGRDRPDSRRPSSRQGHRSMVRG